MFDEIFLRDRLSVAVTAEIADAVRAQAAARGITAADYARGALQGRLVVDGVHFTRLPNLQRVASRPRDRAL